MTIPVTIFTGFLGAGKTTVILSLLEQINSRYPQKDGHKTVLIKNEYGDTQVDSQLAKQSGISGVREILNGCLCCILVGQMKTAITEVLETLKPTRILIETSGSALPGPLVWQINEMQREGISVRVDGVVTVVDCVNFCGYEDTSYTAKLQAKYTDLILLNKWDLVNERQLDLVLDHVNTLNLDTPKLKCRSGDGFVPMDLIFGLDTKSLSFPTEINYFDNSKQHMDLEVQVLTLTCGNESCLTEQSIKIALSDKRLSTETFYRIKGFLRSAYGKIFAINWAFARVDYTVIDGDCAALDDSTCLKLTIVGINLTQSDGNLEILKSEIVTLLEDIFSPNRISLKLSK